jgi:hypothetical protein
MTLQKFCKDRQIEIKTRQHPDGWIANLKHPSKAISFRDFNDSVLDRNVDGIGSSEEQAISDLKSKIVGLTMVVGDDSYHLRGIE